MPMSPSQARVVDPVLTAVAQGYKNGAFVAGKLFPQVPVMARGGKIVAFGKESFKLYATARAPGETTKRIVFGHSGTPFALVDYSLEGQVPQEIMEEAQAVPGIDMASRAVNGVQDIMLLGLEYASAVIATTAGSYSAGNKVTLAGNQQWSDAVNSNPVGDVKTAREAIRGATGKRPNKMVVGPKVHAALTVHGSIIDRIKYTGRDVATPELLAKLFEVDEYVIGDAITANDAGVFSDVWGKFAVLAFTNTAGVADQGLPSYGYTYNLGGYPIVEPPYYDRSSKSWVYPVTRSEAPVMAAPDAGYLISAAVA